MLAGDPPEEPLQAPEQRESAMDTVLGVGHERRVQARVPRSPPRARELVDVACPVAAPHRQGGDESPVSFWLHGRRPHEAVES